jgi:hypothetical protein
MRLNLVVLTLVICSVLEHNRVSGQFNQEKLDFIFRLRGINLEPIESDWGVDGFVKIYVEDLDGDCRGRSETITNNKNPEWKYVFKYTFSPVSTNRRMFIEVRHNNNNSKDDQIGVAEIDLTYGFSNPVTIYRDGSSRGQLFIEHLMSSDLDEHDGTC